MGSKLLGLCRAGIVSHTSQWKRRSSLADEIYRHPETPPDFQPVPSSVADYRPIYVTGHEIAPEEDVRVIPLAKPAI